MKKKYWKIKKLALIIDLKLNQLVSVLHLFLYSCYEIINNIQLIENLMKTNNEKFANQVYLNYTKDKNSSKIDFK